VVGVTVSEEQARFGKEFCRGLPVEIRLQDYRSLKETFDRIFSLGMFEHVGHKNYITFFRCVKGCLKYNGLFLLHTIGYGLDVLFDFFFHKQQGPFFRLQDANHFNIRKSDILRLPLCPHQCGCLHF
jgi:hypothetical protein